MGTGCLLFRHDGWYGFPPVLLGWMLTKFSDLTSAPWLRFRRRKRSPADATSLLLGITVLDAEIDGYPVKAVRLGDRTTFVVDGVTQELSLVPRDRPNRTWSPVGGRRWRGAPEAVPEHRSGDAAFDAKFRVTGKPFALDVLLDAGVRGACLQTLAAHPGVAVEDGRISWSGAVEGAFVEQAARRLVDLAIALEGSDARARLEHSATRDPLAAVRLRSLGLLLRRFGASDETRRALTQALGDPDAAIRLRAAQSPQLALTADATKTLVELARAPSAPRAIRAEALSSAVPALSRERAGELALEIALAPKQDDAMRNQAVRLVGQLSPPGAVEQLVQALGAFRTASVAIATALGELGDPSAESALLRLLKRKDAPTRAAVIAALARIGTAASVPPLHEIGSDAAEKAVETIKARLVGARAGQLSVAAGDEAGRLSEPEGEAGRVSMAKPVPASRSSR